MATGDELFLDNDTEIVLNLKNRVSTTGVKIPSTGLAAANFKVRFSLTQGGSSINATMDLPLIERSGKPGEYYVNLDGDVARTYLAVHVGKKIWVIAGDGTNVLVQWAVTVRAVRVV